MMNKFHKTGAYAIYSTTGLVLLSTVVIIFGFIASKTSLILLAVIGVFAIIGFLSVVSKAPKHALNLMFGLSFLLIGFTRFVVAPFGLVIDFMIFLAWIIVFFKSFKGADWSIKNNSLTICWTIWMGYNFLQILNPEARSLEAWIYAVRGTALYSFLLIPLIFLIYNQKKDYKLFIDIWFFASLLLGLYGIKQFLFGVAGFEQRWLDEGAGIQHVLWGKLRVFSFLSDAGQFGGSQGHASCVAIIFGLKEPNKKRKLFYFLTGIIAFIGMAISGTRGAMFVPIGGFALYLVLSKNLKIIAIGSFIGAVLGYLLVFTMIMNSNPTIARMRSAFDSNDASMNVRKENRAILDNYMSSRPFGGGVGSAGAWGERFTPGTFLAKFQTDGMYVRIHAEEGIIGLYLYLGLILFILGQMIWKTWNIKDPILYQQMAGLTSGVAGMLLANYGNAYTGQMPSNLVYFFSMAFVYMAPKWDKGEEWPVFGDISHLKAKNIITSNGKNKLRLTKSIDKNEL